VCHRKVLGARGRGVDYSIFAIITNPITEKEKEMKIRTLLLLVIAALSIGCASARIAPTVAPEVGEVLEPLPVEVVEPLPVPPVAKNVEALQVVRENNPTFLTELEPFRLVWSVGDDENHAVSPSPTREAHTENTKTYGLYPASEQAVFGGPGRLVAPAVSLKTPKQPVASTRRDGEYEKSDNGFPYLISFSLGFLSSFLVSYLLHRRDKEELRILRKEEEEYQLRTELFNARRLLSERRGRIVRLARKLRETEKELARAEARPQERKRTPRTPSKPVVYKATTRKPVGKPTQTKDVLEK